MIIIMIIIGGVKSSMYRDLPSPLVAEFGFQVQFSILILCLKQFSKLLQSAWAWI